MIQRLSVPVWRLLVVLALAGALLAPGVMTHSMHQPASVAWSQTSPFAMQGLATPTDAGTVEPLATASLAPETTLAYLAITTDVAGDQYALAEELAQRAGLGDYLDLAEAETADLLAGVDSGLALSAFGGGEAALVVTDLGFVEEGALSDPASLLGTPEVEEVAAQGLAFVIAARDPDAAGDVAQHLVAEDASARDVAVEEVEEADVTILVSPPGPFGEDGIATARLADLVIVAPTLADVLPFVDVFSGTEGSLTDTDAFDRARQELSNDFLAYGFINGPDLSDAIEPLIEEAADQGADLNISTDQLTDRLNVSTAYNLWVDDPGLRLDTISVPAEGAELPPAPEPFDSTLDEQVPEDTLLFLNGSNLGETLAPSLDMLGILLAQAAAEDPTFPIPLPSDATAPDDPEAFYEFVARFLAFNPRTDLIDQLAGEWALALWVRSTDDPSDTGGVFLSGVDDETRLTDVTSKLSVWGNLLVIGLLSQDPEGEEILFGEEPVGASLEEVDGNLTQIIDIPIVDLGTTVQLQWGIVDGQFILSANGDFSDAIEGGASLADSARYQAVMAELPEDRFAVVYLDLAQVIELGEEAAANQGADTDALPDLSAIQAIASVSFERGDVVGTSTLLYIEEE